MSTIRQREKKKRLGIAYSLDYRNANSRRVGTSLVKPVPGSFHLFRFESGKAK